MGNIIHVKQSTLDALLLIAGKKDIRHYLNGLRIEWTPEYTRVIGCDGCRLAIKIENHENQGSGAVTIPRDVVERLPKRASIAALVSITNAGDNWAILAGGATINFQDSGDQYPDWRRITHGLKTSGEAAGYNLDFLQSFEKAGAIIGGGKLRVGNRTRVHHNGSQAALVTLDGIDGFAGVVMPLKDQVGSAGALFPADIAGTANPENEKAAA